MRTNWYKTRFYKPSVGDVVFIVVSEGNLDLCKYDGYSFTSVRTIATYKAEEIRYWTSLETIQEMLKEGGYL